ncbi:MAG: ribose 1,5-bisphosphate isomerase [Candidatus Altiarchaeota archaeon]
MVLREVERTYRDIKSMKVRGALDIAIEAAKTLKYVVKNTKGPTKNIVRELKSAGKLIRSSRPTAVSLPNSIDYILHIADQNKKLREKEFKQALTQKIDEFIADQKDSLKRIAEYGSRLIRDGDDILTHCNSDTALQVIIQAHRQGKKINVVCDETRPRNQGYLSVKALKKAGLNPTLIIDSSAYYHMRALEIDKVIVGADAICANGDVVNKIGTAQVALAAASLGIDVIVAAESIKFSPNTLIGNLVEIEERDPKEVTKIKGVKILNPAFDITPHQYVSMIVTEEGVMPPQAAYQFLKQKYSYSWEWEK